MKKPARHRLIEARDAVTGLVVIGDAGKIFRLAEIYELADEEIELSIVVVVEPYGARRPSRSSDPGFLGDISKCYVAVVPIERVAQGRIGIVEIAFAAIYEVYVHPAVVVVVEKGAACSGGFGQIFFRRFAGSMDPGYVTGGRRHLFKGIYRR